MNAPISASHDRASNPAAPPPPWGIRSSAGSRALRVAGIALIASVVSIATLLFEFVKQWAHPDITPWESHAATVAFATLAATAAAYVTLRQRDRLYGAMLDEAGARLRAAGETARLHALLSATIESNRDGVLVTDLDGTPTIHNSALLHLFRIDAATLTLPRGELSRRLAEEIIRPADFAASVNRWRQTPDAEGADLIEFKDGRVFERTTMPQRTDGVVIGRIWRFHDVTAQHETQKHLQMLAHTLRSVAECVSVTDMEDRIIFVNQAFLDVYGYTQHELVGTRVTEVRSDRTPPEVASRILPATLAGGWRGEIWNRRKDGSEFPIALSTSVVRDERGDPVALVGVARDITEERRTEDALRRGRESETIVTLAAGIAHEFNNVLQVILGNTAIAADDLPHDSPAREPLRAVLHAAERARNLTAQLVAYAGRGTLTQPVDVDLNDVIRSQIPAWRALLPDGVTLATDCAPGIPAMRADPSRMEQVLHSLVTNASEAMAGRKGTIRLATRVEQLPSLDRHEWVTTTLPQPGRYVCVTVEDQGPGMTPDVIARVFDPFFSTKFLGRGMGLPAVLGIMRSVGGAVAIDSEQGVGTRVIVACPAYLGSSAARIG